MTFMTRAALRKVSAAALTLAAAVLAVAQAAGAASGAPATTAGASASHPELSGVWQVIGYERSIRTIDGKMPPLRPEAKKVYEQNIVARKQLKPREDLTRCVPPGTPRVLWAPLPIQIVQTARKVFWLHEYQHLIRHVYMDEPLPRLEDMDPSYMGESVGHWDGDTLVIETQGFNAKTFLDRDGMPHSDQMRLTERVRLIDGGKHLEDRVTIDDSKTFTAPWTARVVFERKPGVEVSAEYHCVLKYEEF